MISQMDQVYANASVTIIAAAGENVQMGLPGVSVFPRRPQRWVDVQNTTLLELPYGEDGLLSSKWASRGWTYQEGYLSQRRIIFTPDQVLFLCNRQYLEEYVHPLWKDGGGPLHRNLKQLNRIFPTFSPSGLLLSTSSLLSQVEQYSTRELSYSSDSLNAFRGILNYYTTGHFRGLKPTTHLGWGLLAEHVRSGEALSVHLDWHHEVPAKRRLEFPSWAWTGWGGPLTFGKGILVHKKDVKHYFRLSQLIWEVSVEAEGEKTLDMCDFASICSTNAGVVNDGLYPRSLESSPRRLLITCRVLPIHFRKVKLSEDQRGQMTEIEFENTGKVVRVGRPALSNSSLAVLELWEGIYVGAPHHLDQILKQKDCVIGLLFLSVGVTGHAISQIGCLLARQVEDGSYERVGLVRDALPYLLDGARSPLIYLDGTGGILDRVKLPERLREQLFDKVGERRTICLL